MTEMNKRHSKSRMRKRSDGASIMLLCLILGMIVLPMVAFLSFEIVRAVTMQEQLRTACEAAALSGAAVLAGSDNLHVMETHNQLSAASLEVFRANALYEVPLSSASAVSNSGHCPAANASSLFVELLDPNSDPPNQPVPMGDTKGRIVHTVGSFGLTPVFGNFLGITGPYTIKGESFARVPQLDIVLCFDVSGSIDDQTPVTFVKRHWDVQQAKIKYTVTTAGAGSPTTGGLAQGRIYDILHPPPEGTGVNAMPPQNLDNASLSSNTRPLSFSSSLRGSPNAGSPPGNYPSNTNVGTSSTFTDLIVNISENSDGTLSVPFTSPGGFYYPNIETVVEAARGNLESINAFNSARCNTVANLSGIAPRIGYKADYLAQAKKKVRPLVQAQAAAKEFFTIMNTNSEVNFGMTCFSTNASSFPTQTDSEYNVSSNYSAGGTGQFPFPGVQLDKTNSKFSEVSSAVDLTVANGSTNMGDALLQAKTMLAGQHRSSAKMAVVMFTDGQPTVPSSGSYPAWYARSIAYQLKDMGVPIYTIGLAQNNEIVPGECNILNDDPNRTITYVDTNGQAQSYTPGGSNAGIGSIAGNGSKFFLVTNSANLRLTFENIARQLVQRITVGE